MEEINVKIVHNSDYYQHKVQYKVKCLKHQKDAILTVFFRSIQLCKTDIQLTPIESGMKCSLWEEDNYHCIECPHKPKT